MQKPSELIGEYPRACRSPRGCAHGWLLGKSVARVSNEHFILHFTFQILRRKVFFKKNKTGFQFGVSKTSLMFNNLLDTHGYCVLLQKDMG